MSRTSVPRQEIHTVLALAGMTVAAGIWGALLARVLFELWPLWFSRIYAALAALLIGAAVALASLRLVGRRQKGACLASCSWPLALGAIYLLQPAVVPLWGVGALLAGLGGALWLVRRRDAEANPVLPIVAFPEPLTLNEAKTDIRVDGHLSDWPEARMLVLDRESQVVQGEMLWKTPDDFSGRVFLTYDSQFLYLGAIVLKPSAVVNENDKSTLWNGDCIELFLSADPSFRQSRRLAKGDFHLGFSPGKDCQNPQMYCFNHNTEVTGGRVVARKVQKGYVLEACVPLAFFSGLAVGKGKTVGLEVTNGATACIRN